MNYVQYFSYADYNIIYCNVFKKPVWLIHVSQNKNIALCLNCTLHMNRFNLIYGDVIVLYTNKQN